MSIAMHVCIYIATQLYLTALDWLHVLVTFGFIGYGLQVFKIYDLPGA